MAEASAGRRTRTRGGPAGQPQAAAVGKPASTVPAALEESQWADCLPPRAAWPPGARRTPCGLRNLGNSCFLNAILQALAHCPPLANTVLDAPVEERGSGGAAAAASSSAGAAQSFGGPCGAPACGQLYEDGGGAWPGPVQGDGSANRGGAAGPPGGDGSGTAHLATTIDRPPPARGGRPVPCAHCLLWSAVRRSLDPDTAHPDAPRALWSNLSSTISRTLTPGRQEDAHEFLRTLLDAADRDRRRGLAAAAGGAARPPPAGAWVSEVDAAFGGRLLSRVTCDACGAHSDTADPCLDLSVEVGPAVSSLEDALLAFARPEPLAGDDAYRCASCGTVGPATKRLALAAAPPALVIHLKRFAARAGPGRGAGRAGLAPASSYGHAATAGGAPGAGHGGLPPPGAGRPHTFPLSPSPHPGPLPAKITRHVPFPATLALPTPLLAPGTPPGPAYALTGVVVHAGPSPRGGHYTALVRGPGGDWFLADDGRVVRLGGDGAGSGLAAVLAAQAYVLFYARTGEGGGGRGSARRRGAAPGPAWTPPRPARAAPAAAPAPPAAAPAPPAASRSPSPKGNGVKRPTDGGGGGGGPIPGPVPRRRRSASTGRGPSPATHPPAAGPTAPVPAAPLPPRIAYQAPPPPRSRTSLGAPPRTRGAAMVAAAVAGGAGGGGGGSAKK